VPTAPVGASGSGGSSDELKLRAASVAISARVHTFVSSCEFEACTGRDLDFASPVRIVALSFCTFTMLAPAGGRRAPAAAGDAFVMTI
jgi:hypothetical protein